MCRLIGSIVITVPSTYFILNSGGHKGDDHHLHQGAAHHGEGKGEHVEEEEEAEETSDEAPAAEDEEKSEDKEDDKVETKEESSSDDKDEKSDDAEEKSESTESGKAEKSGDNKIEGKPASSDNEGKNAPEEPSDNKISEPTKDGDDSFDKEHEIETDSDNKTIHKPDAKGGAKRRVESANAIKLNDESQDQGDISKKQAGLTNTDTKHSTDPTSEGKSMKSEGAPETAKLQGTVQPDRPAR